MKNKEDVQLRATIDQAYQEIKLNGRVLAVLAKEGHLSCNTLGLSPPPEEESQVSDFLENETIRFTMILARIVAWELQQRNEELEDEPGDR